jgi:hypothetical protein
MVVNKESDFWDGWDAAKQGDPVGVLPSEIIPTFVCVVRLTSFCFQTTHPAVLWLMASCDRS